MEILSHPSYTISADRNGGSTTYTVGFGSEPASNAELTAIASKATYNLPSELHGTVALLTGKASLPVSYALAHNLSHYHKAIGVYDPKLAAFVVAISHDKQYPLGSLIQCES